MHAIFVTIKVKPERREDFIKALLEDAKGSVEKEPGCLRFDVLQDKADPNTLYLYEVYRDEKALETHRTMPHYIKWRETVKDWFAADTSRVIAAPVFPPESAWKKK